jgi:hypothetical protein
MYRPFIMLSRPPSELRSEREASEPPDEVGPWITTERSGWSWDEGPCPCGGIIRRGHAGPDGWSHRCNRCGTAYLLFPLIVHVSSEGELSVPEVPCPDAKRHQERLLAMIRPEHITEDVKRAGALYGGWAQRVDNRDE